MNNVARTIAYTTETTAEDIRAQMAARYGAVQIEERTEEHAATFAPVQAQAENAILDAYDAGRNGAGMAVSEALGVIAAFFYNPSEITDSEGNAYNALAFQQRGVMGNMCQNAKWMLENARQHELDLNTKLDQQEATADGSEISLRNLTVTLDQIERCRFTQIPACEDWFAQVKAAYAVITGEDWKPFAKKGKSAREQTSDVVKARIAALRGGTPSEENEGSCLAS